MAYCLKRRRTIANEIRRIIDAQLAQAIHELRAIGDRRSDDAIHEARRHVKKVRAVLHIAQAGLDDAYYPANAQLRRANQMLAPIADGRSIIDTVDRLKHRYRCARAQQTFTALRAALVDRVARIDHQAAVEGVLPTVAAMLRRQQKRLAESSLKVRGFRDMAPGLERSFRRTKRSLQRVASHPTTHHFCVWRRRVKNLWFQLRLIEDRCRNQLVADQRRLEALDGCLGEHDNIMLLERILTSEEPLPRDDTAFALHLLRRYQRHLRRHAMSLGCRVSREDPRHFVRRIRNLWRSSKRAEAVTHVRTPWRHAA